MSCPRWSTRLPTSAEWLDATREPELVARDLIGCVLVGRGASGIIVETEAYHQREPACHGYSGAPTARTAPLFGDPGTAYVYFTYGMHWCTNLVTGKPGVAAAVLIRAVHPISGVELMRERRASAAHSLPETSLCSGPAKLTQALDIRGTDNGCNLLMPAPGFPRIDPRLDSVLRACGYDVDQPLVGQRIGITKAMDLPWRFGMPGSSYLSRPFRGESPTRPRTT